jgi:hypothetical protein
MGTSPLIVAPGPGEEIPELSWARAGRGRSASTESMIARQAKTGSKGKAAGISRWNIVDFLLKTFS